MKQVIKIQATDSNKTKVQLSMELISSIDVLTQHEQQKWKADVSDKAFSLMRDLGFSCQEIKFK